MARIEHNDSARLCSQHSNDPDRRTSSLRASVHIPAHTVVSTGASHIVYFGPSMGLPYLEVDPAKAGKQHDQGQHYTAYVTLCQDPCQTHAG